MRRLLAHAFALCCLLGLSLAAFLYWLAATEPGLRWLAREIGAHVPGVAVARTEGTLMGGFALGGLAYRDADTEVRLDALEVRWAPADLWRGVLRFQALRAEGLRVVATGKGDSEPPEWPQWKLPLELAIDDFRLADAEIRTGTDADAQPIRIDRLDAALHVAAPGLRLDRLSLALPEATAEVSGRVGFALPRRVDLRTAWTLRLPDRPEVRATGSILGDAQRLILRQSLAAPLPAELTVVVAEPLGKPAWTARVEVPEFLPNRIDPRWPPWPIALSLRGEGTLAEAAVAADFAAKIPEAGEARGELKARYREPGEVVVERLHLALPRTGAELDLDGTARHLGTHPEFTLAARWRNLRWPLNSKARAGKGGPKGQDEAWRSPEGRLTVAGNPEDIRFDLAGQLRELPVEAGGNIGLEPRRTVFRGIRVRGAGTEAAVDGSLGERLDFTWTLRADDLGLWLPGARGRLNSRGTLQGPKTAPAVEAELAARALRYEDHGVRDLTLKLRAGLQPDAPIEFDLAADDLSAAGQTLDARLTGRGTRAKHRLAGRLDGRMPREGRPPLAATLDFGADGGLRDETWAGELTRFDFAAPPLGRWALRRPAGLRLSAAGGELRRACWASDGTEWCLRAEFGGAGDWRAATELADLPLSRFGAALPEEVSVAGTLNGEANFSGQGARIGEGRLELSIANARLARRVEGAEALRFEPEPLALRAWVSERGTRLEFVADQPGLASIQGRLALYGPPDPARLRQAPLAAEARVDLPNLALFDPFVRDIDRLRGRFHADLRLDGTASAPVVQVRAAVPEAGFALPKLGIALSGVALEAVTHEDNHVTLRGRATSGKGEIRLDGAATLSEAAGWPANLTIQGRRFLAADLPEAEVFVSPDLALAFERGKLAVTGKVEVPEASLRAPEQAGAVKPSDDVVMVGTEKPNGGPALAVETRVDVVLGDKVRVQGAGFTGRVDGQVRIDQAPKGPMLGTGQIMVREGRYSFYGVELAINDGRILFAHSPVDNPGLDINVTRQTDDDVLAGLRVLGTVRKPSVTLYSDRPVPQADILAYLVTGKPLGLTSQAEGGMLQDAAVSLGGSAGSLLAREIGSRLGLGDLFDISVQGSLDAQGISRGYRTGAADGTAAPGAQSTALFLGKYLTPRLYVQYGMGLFQNAYVFRVRYDLGKRWKIQTETGEFSGGDILYQWEK